MFTRTDLVRMKHEALEGLPTNTPLVIFLTPQAEKDIASWSTEDTGDVLHNRIKELGVRKSLPMLLGMGTLYDSTELKVSLVDRLSKEDRLRYAGLSGA